MGTRSMGTSRVTGARLFFQRGGHLKRTLCARAFLMRERRAALGTTLLRAVLHSNIPPTANLTSYFARLHGAALHGFNAQL